MKKLYSLKFSLGECIKSVLNPKPIITGEMFIFSLNLEIIGILPPSFINKGYFPQTSLNELISQDQKPTRQKSKTRKHSIDGEEHILRYNKFMKNV